MITFNIKSHLRGDKHIWYIIMFLSLISIAAVYSSVSALSVKNNAGNEFYLLKHTFFLCIGISITFIIHKLDFSKYLGIMQLALWLSIPLMLYTLTRGVTVGGARRWISVFGLTVQTSDYVRLVLIANLSAMLARRQNIEYKGKDLLTMVTWCGVLIGLLALSSFSTSIILALTCFLLMWIGRVPVKYLWGLVVSSVVLIGFGFIVGITAKRLTGFEIGRLNTVIDRTEDFIKVDLDGNTFIGGEFGSTSEQKNYALLAIANGGIFGKGPGNSGQKQILPDVFSDFVFSIVVEEYGLFGALVVFGLYIWLFYRGVYNIEHTTRAFTGLLSVGLTLSIVLQAISHMVINVGLVPVTGQTLPLVSMGGTSVIFTSVALGIILSVTKTTETT